MEKLSPPSDEGRKSRSDGVQSRERLLMAALRLFAEKGFANTSTREIALAAGTNIASISYYFGDKAGLYRAVYDLQGPHSPERVMEYTNPALTLPAALHIFYGQLLEPLKQGDMARLSMRIWYREMLEPTGMWTEEIDTGIRPAFAGLTQVIARHMGAAQVDDDMSRLVFCVVGLAIHPLVGRDVIDAVAPHLLDSNEAIDTWIDRTVDYAVAIIAAEQARRAPALSVSKP